MVELSCMLAFEMNLKHFRLYWNEIHPIIIS